MYDIKPAVGILTALPHEYAAVYVMLDNPRERIEGIYKYCVATVPRSIGAPLPVVLGLMPDMGNNPASASAARLLIHFSSVAHLIMCGIAGGVPWRKDRDDDIRLGDIVVSDRNGVIQYDNTKLHPDGWQEVRSPPRPPGFALLSAAKELEVQRVLKNRPWEAFLARGAQLEGGVRPEDNIDSRGEVDAATSRIDPRRAPGKPRIFLGTIASANQLLKNVDQRNALADAFGVKAIEMEGSGIADAAWSAEAGYLVIRGVCDYCDEKKGDVWQTAAAVAAASYLRALLALLTTL
jgi:nucleoside phosphorylase